GISINGLCPRLLPATTWHNVSKRFTAFDLLFSQPFVSDRHTLFTLLFVAGNLKLELRNIRASVTNC
ncbi:MAG: hypothetical protein ACREBC_19210, partial [Pyrinomonadaceae bacterium]